MAILFPLLHIPDLPQQGKGCLWQWYRRADGQAKACMSPRYVCDQGDTYRGCLELEATINDPAEDECSQTGDFSDGIRLSSRGTVLFTQERLAVYHGSCSILLPDTDETRMFSGQMELFYRIGSHTDLQEKCRPENHVEGWLAVAGLDRWERFALRVMVAGTFQPDPQTDPFTQGESPSGGMILVLNGFLI